MLNYQLPAPGGSAVKSIIMITNDQEELNQSKGSNQWKIIKLIIAEVFDEKVIPLLDRLKEPKAAPAFYEIKDICAMFKITPQTFHNWRNRGWIIGRKMGKSRFFTKEEVELAMNNHQITKGKVPDGIIYPNNL